MKRFLLAVAAVLAITVGSSFTSSAMAHGPGYGYGHHHGSCGPGFRGGYGYGGGYRGGYGYGGGYSAYRPVVVAPSYGYGYPGYGYGGGYGGGYGSGGVIQIYGPRGGFTFGY